MRTITVAGAAMFGLLIGSFLNVVIWRLPRAESLVQPGSHCPACGHAVSPRDNMPVLSWVLLRGRCRHCRAPISRRYPLVELGTAALFAGMAGRFGLQPPLPAFLYLGAVGLALALIDIDVHRLPNALTLPSYLVGVALLGFAAFADHAPSSFVRAVAGMAITYGFYFLLVLAKPGGMGWGDVKLSGVLGLYLGFLGWGDLVVGTFLAFVLGGVVGLTLIASKRGGRKTKIPFGPYMVAGALIAVFAGHELAHWYVHLMVG